MAPSYLVALRGKGVQPSRPLLQDSNQKAVATTTTALSKTATVSSSTHIEYMLINTGFGALRFSGEFKGQLGRLGFVGNPSSEEVRFHPGALALFDEKGSEWSSGPHACIQKVAFPAGFREFVEIVKSNDKGESIVVALDQAFTTWTGVLLNDSNASLDDVRAVKTKVDAARNVWEQTCRPTVDTIGGRPPEPTNNATHKTKVKGKPMFQYILINRCYGGFSFSEQFQQEMKKWRGFGRSGCIYNFGWTSDKKAIALFDKMGSEWSSSRHARLQKVAVPAGYVEYAHVHEYDGLETLKYIDFTKGVEEVMAKDDPSTMADELIALKSEIDAAKEVWKECMRFNKPFSSHY